MPTSYVRNRLPILGRAGALGLFQHWEVSNDVLSFNLLLILEFNQLKDAMFTSCSLDPTLRVEMRYLR